MRCSFCNKFFRNDFIQRHEQSCSRLFTCVECGKKFKRIFNLQRHDKLVHLKHNIVFCDINDQSKSIENSESDYVPETPESKSKVVKRKKMVVHDQ